MRVSWLCWLLLIQLLTVCTWVTQLWCADDLNYISHGPILGRLSSKGVGVWARTGQPGKFVVRYRTDEVSEQTSAAVTTTIDHDNTGWVELKNLRPNTKYHYDVAVAGDTTRNGRNGFFRTLPDAAEYADPKLNPRGLFNFSFEFGCGNNQNPPNSNGASLPTFGTMINTLKDRINFAILNGDWLYEVRRDYEPGQWLNQVEALDLPRVVRMAPTIVGVWENYKHFLTQGENLARWHRQVPSFFTYDDHEMLNDIWGAGTPGLRDRRAVFRDIGARAWYDYLGWSNPTTFPQRVHFGAAQLKKGSDVLVDIEADFTKIDLKQTINLHVHWGTDTAGVNDNALDGIGGVPNAGVYRIVRVIDGQHLQIEPPARADGVNSYSIGRRSYFHFRVSNCDFFCLDTRGHREMHDTQDPYKKGLSMLGRAQRQWLIEGLEKSDADIHFVVSSVNFMVPHVGGGAVRADNKDDAWTVFYDEREALIDFWDSLSKPVCLLTGDLHNSFVIRITDNVWEFASGPHNSSNHWASDEGDRPPNGPFKYGPREVDIRWSSFYRTDIPRSELKHPLYCVVQVNNVFNNPKRVGEERWVAFPRPQVIFQYYDGRSGALRYAEAVVSK